MDFGMTIVLFLAFLAASLGINVWVRQRQGDVWKEVARELGLIFIAGGWFSNPTIHGLHRDHRVDVRNEVVRHGKSRTIYTVVEVALGTEVSRGLQVYREGVFQKMGKVIGGEDIQVGDSALDEAFIIKGVPEPRAVSILTDPSVKSALLVGQKRHESLRIDSGVVRIRQRGRASGGGILESYIRTAVDLARALEAASRPAQIAATSQSWPAGADPAPAREPIDVPPSDPWIDESADHGFAEADEPDGANPDDWW